MGNSDKVIKLIKEKEQITLAYEHSQAFLKNIVAAVPQYIFWKDVDSIYLGCNQNFAELVGLKSPEEIIGKTDFDLGWRAHGDSAELFRQGDQDTILNGNRIVNQEETLALRNGKSIIALVNKSPILDDEGKVIGVLGHATDITDRKQMERELVEAKEKSEIANRAKSDFIANMSHDIRTPLSGMLGMASILKKQRLSAEGRLAVRNLKLSGQALLELLNEIIEISRVEGGNFPVYDIKFDLKQLFEKVTDLINPSLQQKELEFISHYDSNIPNYLIGDPTRINRIMLNLLSNAAKFTQQGYVSICVEQASQDKRQSVIKITVKDTGIGIPKDKQQIVFTKFTRLSPSYQAGFKGAGLGLAIVKQFIEELNGEIELASDTEEGTTVTCYIPLRKSLSKTIPTNQENILHYDFPLSEESKDNVDLLDKSILLVEDNQIAQMAVQATLAEFNCRVDMVENGQDAIELARKNQYSLILMDIGLPDISGVDVTQKIREFDTKTPIVALTAHADAENETHYIASGMQAVLTKPLEDEKAGNILNQYCVKETFSNSKTIDLKLDMKLMNNNEQSAKEMLVDSLPETRKRLIQAYKNNDLTVLYDEAHKLKGGLCYCGVPKLKEVTLQLLMAIKQMPNDIDETMKEVMNEIDNILSVHC